MNLNGNKNNNLDMELKRLYQEMQLAINEKDKTIEHLQSKNQELIDYVGLLEKNENIERERYLRDKKEVKDSQIIFFKGTDCPTVCQVIWA